VNFALTQAARDCHKAGEVGARELACGAEFQRVAELTRLSKLAERVASSRAKRALDVCLSAGFLLLASPLMLAIAFLILLEGGGPVLFRQARGGLGGRAFEILKFRSMRSAPAGEPVRHASRSDHRVTPIGGFLRRASLDELPQLINVLRGDMSLVGPRPHATAHDLFYEAEVSDYRIRTLVRPGLTGLAQVSGHRGEIRSVDAMTDRVRLDVEYIQRWSIGIDLMLIAKTVVRVPFDPGAF
jgi:putative colanic acid biosynthesis UDP-glucose lipid carrier transferase